MKMHDIFAVWAPHLDSSYVVPSSAGRTAIVETDEDGRGSAFFTVNCDFFAVKTCPGRDQLRWLRNRRCADGAIVCLKDQDVSLHIVELKGNVSPKKWGEIQAQIEGMYLNTLSLSRLMKVPPLTSIVCYVAYKSETVSASNSASSVLLKRPVGAKARPYSASWSADFLALPHGARARIVRGLRSGEDGNADFGAIP